MNNQEAKFILEAYRPDGRDASDARFGEAIAQAERDPELRAWWERQRKVDATLSAKLGEIAPPPGLRESILAGVRASQRVQRRWWSNPAWLAAAAAIVLLAAVTVTLKRNVSDPNLRELASVALNDVLTAHDGRSGHSRELADVRAELASALPPFSRTLNVDLAELRRKNCRTLSVGGREVFELCFQRDGTWFHLYAARRKDFATDEADPHALITSRGGYASTAWADANMVYALVAHTGAEVLRRVI